MVNVFFLKKEKYSASTRFLWNVHTIFLADGCRLAVQTSTINKRFLFHQLLFSFNISLTIIINLSINK
jgi:hypothetical protein